MKYWLFIQVVATWPASPPQLQFLGPLPDPVVCQSRADDIVKAFASVRVMCLPIPDGQTPAAPGKP